MFLLPLVALVALWYRGEDPERPEAWVLTTALAGALTLSAWVAVETGERDEEKVERRSPSVAQAHEEAAERFLLLFGSAPPPDLGDGLLGGPAGRVARGGATTGALGLVAVGAQVGHSGGYSDQSMAEAGVQAASGGGVDGTKACVCHAEAAAIDGLESGRFIPPRLCSGCTHRGRSVMPYENYAACL